MLTKEQRKQAINTKYNNWLERENLTENMPVCKMCKLRCVWGCDIDNCPEICSQVYYEEMK